MRDEQRAGLGIEEGAGKARIALGAFRAAGRGVAGRQDHPIGVELEPRDLGSGEIAVVLLACFSGWRQEKPGSLLPSIWPASAPCVAKCTIRYCASWPLSLKRSTSRSVARRRDRFRPDPR